MTCRLADLCDEDRDALRQAYVAALAAQVRSGDSVDASEHARATRDRALAMLYGLPETWRAPEPTLMTAPSNAPEPDGSPDLPRDSAVGTDRPGAWHGAQKLADAWARQIERCHKAIEAEADAVERRATRAAHRGQYEQATAWSVLAEVLRKIADEMPDTSGLDLDSYDGGAP